MAAAIVTTTAAATVTATAVTMGVTVTMDAIHDMLATRKPRRDTKGRPK